MKLSELIENLICLEELEKEKKRENGAPTSKAFKDYAVYIAPRSYELYNKDGSIGIYRFNEPNPKASVLRDRYRLVDFGFIDDLVEEDIELARKWKEFKDNKRLEERLKGASIKEEVLIPQELMQKAHEVVEEAKKHDVVNHPKHYTQGKIECIEAMKAMLTKEEFRGFLRGSIFKYQWRVMDKNGIEDLEKAQWYLDYLIKELRELDKKD